MKQTASRIAAAAVNAPPIPCPVVREGGVRASCDGEGVIRARTVATVMTLALSGFGR